MLCIKHPLHINALWEYKTTTHTHTHTHTLSLSLSLSLSLTHTHTLSAGVGRSGTFIAIDIALQQAEGDGALDVPSILTKLRNQRMKMVQTVVCHVAHLQILRVVIESDC